MTRLLWWATVVSSLAASAQPRPLAPVDCDDNVAECKEDCAISFGGTTNLKARSKLSACINKCSRAELDCRERFFETRRNNLDEGAISGSPSSRDVDSDGMPVRAAAKKEEKREEDLRDDRRRAEPEPAPAPAAEKKRREPEAKPAYELKEEEVPRSSRSQISKVDAKPEKAADKPADPPAPKADEKPAAEARPEVVARPDPPARAEEPAPPPRKTEQREEPKKKQEKRRSLDEWDPDAL